MTLERYLGDSGPSPAWEELGAGAPTILALAHLCGRALVSPPDERGLSTEAMALLYAARHRGLFELKGTNLAFDASERLLTVYIEQEGEGRIRFRRAGEPTVTIRFFEAFRELCAAGLVMHHLYREFSLTTRGFARALAVQEDEIREALALAESCGPGG